METKDLIIRPSQWADLEQFHLWELRPEVMEFFSIRDGQIIEESWKAELWRIYIADASLRGRGLGRQAMEAVMKYCFDELGLAWLYLDHYTGNPASHLYLSLGFRYEGILRQNCRKNGVLYDVHLMSMLRDEYCEMYGD